MKTRVVSLPVLAVALLTMLMAEPALAKPRDSVRADVMDCLGLSPADCEIVDQSLQLEVSSGPAGRGATGLVRFTSGFGQGRAFVDARASCLNVAGTTAIIGYTGRVTGFLIPDGLFITGYLRVIDGGGAGSRLDMWQATRTGLSGTPLPAPQDCSTFSGGPGTNANDTGDIVIRDRPGRRPLRPAPA